MKIPFVSAYKSRALSVDAQRCINLYPAANPPDAPFPFTHFPTPGLITLSTATTSGFRALYRSTDNQLFAIVGNTIYSISNTWVFTVITTVVTTNGPVEMLDNGIDLLIVDGTGAGYVIDLPTLTPRSITDVAFYGSVTLCVIDGYFILHKPGTTQWYISGELATTWDPLDIVSKNGYPDIIIGLGQLNRLLWIFGESTTEVWTNTGASDFTFERIPGVFLQHGCAAPHSIRTMDASIYLLARDQQGKCFVARTEAQGMLRISTDYIDSQIQSYGAISDAIGYCHQSNGHFFYVLTFPTANKTWVFDRATGEWHERAWMDAKGVFNRHRSACYAFFNNTSLVGDWENGNLYHMSSLSTTDYAGRMRHVRTSAELVNEGARSIHQQVRVDMRVGDGLPSTLEKPMVSLRWSNDGGRSWGNPVMRDFGGTGQYLRNVEFNRLGYARNRVYEVSYSAPVPCELSGLYLKAVGGAA